MERAIFLKTAQLVCAGTIEPLAYPMHFSVEELSAAHDFL
jgi:hypothetical protein